MRGAGAHHALTLLETIVCLLLIAVLFTILLPALSTARMASYREQCANNQRRMGRAWELYLQEHEMQFPWVPFEPGWHYGGMRFSSIDGSPFPDTDRPLTTYLGLYRTANLNDVVCYCPADRGITSPALEIGTGRRTAFRSFGTSYRANAALVDARLAGPSIRLRPDELRGLSWREITTDPSRLVLMGDPVWYEVAEQTQRTADWHGEPHTGNILFLDGSVRFRLIKPRVDRNQAVVFEPVMPGTLPDDSADKAADS